MRGRRRRTGCRATEQPLAAQHHQSAADLLRAPTVPRASAERTSLAWSARCPRHAPAPVLLSSAGERDSHDAVCCVSRRISGPSGSALALHSPGAAVIIYWTRWHGQVQHVRGRPCATSTRHAYTACI